MGGYEHILITKIVPPSPSVKRYLLAIPGGGRDLVYFGHMIKIALDTNFCKGYFFNQKIKKRIAHAQK